MAVHLSYLVQTLYLPVLDSFLHLLSGGTEKPAKPPLKLKRKQESEKECRVSSEVVTFIHDHVSEGFEQKSPHTKQETFTTIIKQFLSQNITQN